MSTSSLRWTLVVGVVAFAAALLGIDARATYGARVSSDEPQYLLTALSLAEDFDLDISDEIDEEAYVDFHEVALNPQTIALDDSGQRLSPHDPLLPLVLAIPMGIGGWGGAKLTMAVIAALTAMTSVVLAVRRIGVSAPIASTVIGLFFTAAPLSAYGTQIYPAMLAALLTTVGVLAVGSANRSLRSVVAALVVVALPWLAVKYVLNAAVLSAAALWTLRSETSVRRAAAWASLLAAAGVVYLVVHQRVYGGWTVYAAGDHFVNGEFEVIGTDPDYVARSNRLIGLLIDRSYGLAAWNPAFLAVPAALAWSVRRRLRDAPVLLASIGAAWIMATWIALTMHGWWFPGRQVVHVLPLFAVLVAALIDEHRRLVAPFVSAALLGTMSWLWLAIEASADRRTLIVDFDETSNPWYRAWSQLLPDHRIDGPWDQFLTIIWLAILATSAAIAWRSSPVEPDIGETEMVDVEEGNGEGAPPDFPHSERSDAKR